VRWRSSVAQLLRWCEWHRNDRRSQRGGLSLGQGISFPRCRMSYAHYLCSSLVIAALPRAGQLISEAGDLAALLPAHRA
jgi:hypothetical protein